MRFSYKKYFSLKQTILYLKLLKDSLRTPTGCLDNNKIIDYKYN